MLQPDRLLLFVVLSYNLPIEKGQTEEARQCYTVHISFLHMRPIPLEMELFSLTVHLTLKQGSHGDWKTWKMKMVMEKSLKSHGTKVMECCDSDMEFDQFCHQFVFFWSPLRN